MICAALFRFRASGGDGGGQIASASGLAKELSDSNGGSGFSFADMTANRAGILFAGGLLNKRFTLLSVADDFTVPSYMPAVEGLPEGSRRPSCWPNSARRPTTGFGASSTRSTGG